MNLAITNNLGNHSLTGLGQAVGAVSVEDVFIDGLGGANSLTVGDATNIVYGAALAPLLGLIYRPNGADSGEVYLANRTLFPVVGFDNINGDFAVNGDTDGSGDRDTFTVLSTSTTGLASAFGELTAANGSDVINVSDSLVTISYASLGALRSVALAMTGGNVTFQNRSSVVATSRPRWATT
jgi:hypothetical protein